jgi:aspartate/methionine/tyrosine aminotransferase
VNETFGAFYSTIVFREGVLKPGQHIYISNMNVQALVQQWTQEEMPLDKRFVYYLLGSKGICVVPISSFCSSLQGFRVTLLEENEEELIRTFITIRDAIVEYLHSAQLV